ncbi:hypothetical protein H2201_004203 [Coniosporium apollinis]|uniref:Uncharacterized protein n=1 Tax=Coniosporium apollinis TaxID=61459 RepID=A0ABQ9NWP8_9PEZI|nr:hypothetical protein H2201_004203 [Coniosporium apollinis]
MAGTDSLEALQGLHQDLLAFTESRLPTIDRLSLELEARIEEFRKLLDKPRKDDNSRRTLASGTIRLGDVEYSVNEEFKHETIQVADALDLDELESAKLYLAAQDDAQELDRSPLTASIIRFHERRQFLLECLRLVVAVSVDDDRDESIRQVFKEYVEEVAGTKNGQRENASRYWRKCISSLGEIREWLQQLAERIQSASIIGQTPSPEMAEIYDFQRTSLTRQHESLAAITTDLVKCGYANVDELRFLLPTLQKLDRYDLILIHYIPVLICLIDRINSSKDACSLRDARSLHETITMDGDSWALRNFRAATVVWWLAEYSGRYIDNPVGSPLQGVDLEAEAEGRSALFLDALKDGAFHFMLSATRDIMPHKWAEPTKAGLMRIILQESFVLPADTVGASDHFHLLVMQQLQAFVVGFITNMPDTLRKLKVDEDDLRRNAMLQFQQDSVYHLERFLIIIAHAFEGWPDAAGPFLTEPESNLYGFLQWAAKRQTTPRAAAFSEMLRAIAKSEELADAAHEFLLQEGASAPGKLRQKSTMSWTQIFSELQHYASGTGERHSTASTHLYVNAQNQANPEVELESPYMLECYLRLISRLCQRSPDARNFVLSNSSFRLHEILFQLCARATDPTVWAGAFTALASLLTNKTQEVGEGLWHTLDQWICGFSPTQNLPRTSNVQVAPAWTEQSAHESLSRYFEQANAFVTLLHVLITPYPDHMDLNDALPFPEHLGSPYRMPGVDSYVDLVVGKIFGSQSTYVEDAFQLRVLRWNCLNFVATCLSTFNEDLVIFANRSNVAVDTAIGASSLLEYARLHPFARTMEWLFNDKVLSALFATAHQDITEVQKASPDSPLILSLLRSIEVMGLVMKFQATYLDIVRPLLKTQSTARRTPVSNGAIASFEDAVLNNLDIVVDLGLYCGAGHQDLTIASLRLLETLSSSRKLAASATAGFGRRSGRSKIIGILEKDNDAERIARLLTAEMQLDPRELEAGPTAPGFVIKSNILEFLNSCLATLPNRPTLAHALLGFSCGDTTLDINADSLFASGSSLFHALLRLAAEYPDTDEESFLSWRLMVKQGCLDIIAKLWRSPLSSVYTMAELRSADFLFVQAVRQIAVTANTFWDGRVVDDPEFLFTESADALSQFLRQRAAFYDYVARELRMTVQNGMPSLKSRIESTLLGLTVLPDGEQLQNPSIFDLFDFVELQVGGAFALPPLKFHDGLDFSICRTDESNPPLYDLRSVEELLTLRAKELKKTGRTSNPADEHQLQEEAQSILLCLLGENQRAKVLAAREEAISAWVQLMTVMLACCEFEASTQTAVTLQAVQMILPKLEKSFSEDAFLALQLSRLAKSLIQNINLETTTLENSKADDFANDRLFQLFRTALSGIYCLVSNPNLREICYQVCYRYLQGILKASTKGSPLARHCIRAVKASGEKLFEVACDDAYAGQGTCRISSLQLLDALVSLAVREDSKIMIEAFAKLNFIGVLVDSIKMIATDLAAASAADVPGLLSYYHASLSLLARIAQTRLGAAHVLNASLFQSVQDSQIFSTDPDIGFEIEDPAALKKFFELMLSVLRVIVAVVISRGAQNSQTMHQARQFLKDTRASIVAIFKRHAKVGGIAVEGVGDLSELVDAFTLLISATGFLEHEETKTTQKSAANMFS